MLTHADHIVVWNYYALQGLPPQASKDLAQRLASVLPSDRWTMSLGLWAKNGGSVTPEEMSAGIAAAIDGGTRRIWITPADQITDAHWNALLRAWLMPMKPAPSNGVRAAGLLPSP